MRINASVIGDMGPCKDRFNNFKNNNPAFDGTIQQFLSLDNITYNDKVWVCTRLLTKNQLVHWGIMCAESVKHHYEDKNSTNKSMSILLDYLKTIKDFTKLTEKQRGLIRTYRDAAYAANAYAANAAAAAADVAAAYNAVDAAAYAANAVADAAAADVAAAAREEQQNLNLLYLVSCLE